MHQNDIGDERQGKAGNSMLMAFLCAFTICRHAPKEVDVLGLHVHHVVIVDVQKRVSAQHPINLHHGGTIMQVVCEDYSTRSVSSKVSSVLIRACPYGRGACADFIR